MGGHSYSLLHHEPGWKTIRFAKTNWKWAGILTGTITTYAFCNELYMHKRCERNNNRDAAFMSIKKSFGTLHPDFINFHEQRFGKID